MASKEEKDSNITEKINENKNENENENKKDQCPSTFENLKQLYLENYDSEKTIKILSGVVGAELIIMTLKTIIEGRYLLIIPYIVGITSIALLFYGITKKNFTLVKQFRFSYLGFYIYYIFSLLFAVFSILAILLVIYISDNPYDLPEKAPSPITFFTETFSFYGVFQFILYTYYYIVTISYMVNNEPEEKKEKEN
ncbi:hypothetical protein BCR32DRAFT_290992 [Anaeromyces robustus]|uniref:Transmembrane protein n=1 Tax=Anaeromyces robustus TaxID=1754192 RepID=A0A1Y1XGS7_9FUNG|nr:hypothetical protein BCR32DRAFT_290992 [Anaeromyces robustus]|eukprot:ORX84933.1 hypothetical protein BCR32DRAFT_290992 [Anaeromyces robustus]